MVVAIFRSRLRPEHADEFHALADELMRLAVEMPGFVSYKVFAADDGERCSIIEFESHAHLEAWRQHPIHQAAQQRGRERFYAEYTLQIVDPVRGSRFGL